MTSFMEWDLKKRTALHPEDIQQLLQVRREAHFYDISNEVVEEAQKLIDAEKGLFFSDKEPIPPTRTGYMRLNVPDLQHRYVWREEGLLSVTVNAILWHDKKYWFIHDPGKESEIEIVPFRIETNIDLEFAKANARERIHDAPTNPEDVKAWRVRSITPISQYASQTLYETIENALEELFEMCAMVFDMIAETRATTVQHESVPYAFATKHKPFYTKTTVVKIALSKCRNKYLRGQAEPTGRKMPWHEPRGHFAHFRVTQPNCAHTWGPRFAEDDGKHYKCSGCGELKTWRVFPNGRGSRDVGIIKTNYEVVQ